MSNRDSSDARSRRPPLTDSTLRINNSQNRPAEGSKERNARAYQEAFRSNTQSQANSTLRYTAATDTQEAAASTLQDNIDSPVTRAAQARLCAIAKEMERPHSNRNSQVSTTSTNASGSRLKTHIGPWHLGKTLGKGATARVRFARHAISGQEAAVKIVKKKSVQLTQAGSLASLDRRDAKLPDVSDGFRKMPFGIEREVAIMKIIHHPNVMEIYDIWENRTEIYLVLEHVNNGELFEHISGVGRMNEVEAMRIFRQILSAMTHCHALSICHRDLKPENILVDKKGCIKIADFGMAALQQSPEHRLQTACGSPHYAAPEVIESSRRHGYLGSKADVWSMGCILFAELCGHLPFDDDDIHKLLEIIRKGKFVMPEFLSPEAKDLIRRMLKVNPDRRISTNEIWQHSLLQKYSYLDNLESDSFLKPPTIKDCGRPVLRRSEIDRELFRHLRPMWHAMDESKIIRLLLNDEPNIQKLFYTLLLQHRDKQLENYIPDINYSNSDYHHGQRPLAQIQKLSTRQFTQPKQRGHGRQVSRFTVVSNGSKSQRSRRSSDYANTEGGETVHSYDPYNVSRPRYLTPADSIAHAKVVVHRGRASLQENLSPRKASTQEADGGQTRRSKSSAILMVNSNNKPNTASVPRGYISRSSLASSTRSRGSGPAIRVAMAHRRGVSFLHGLKNSNASLSQSVEPQKERKRLDRHSRFSEVTDDGGDFLRAVSSPAPSSRYVRSKKAMLSTAQQAIPGPKDRTSRLWQEDVRQLSSSLAKDCDEAFNRISVASDSRTPGPTSPIFDGHGFTSDCASSDSAQRAIPHNGTSSVPPGLLEPAIGGKHHGHRKSRDRPLPPPPARTDSTKMELYEARRKVEELRLSGDAELSPRYLDRMVSHIDKLLDPSPVRASEERRVVSAPVPSANGRFEGRNALQAINEASSEDASPKRAPEHGTVFATGHQKRSHRNRSAPQSQLQEFEPQFLTDRTAMKNSDFQNSIRMVQSLSTSPPKVPAPLNIRKISSKNEGREVPPTTRAVNDCIEPRKQNKKAEEHNHEYHRKLSKLSSSYGNVKIASAVPSEDLFATESNLPSPAKPKSRWFQRITSRTDHEDTVPSGASSSDTGTQCMRNDAVSDAKHKTFGIHWLFKKKASNLKDVPAFQIQDGDDASLTSVDENSRSHLSRYDGGQIRQIEAQRPWYARLFRVKPAKRHVCFNVSKHRARREITSILREWKKFGIRDVAVDKSRNTIFARVTSSNYLQMRGVSFACEILTVIEHGKRMPLSIVRFTQEKGAASSFHRVVATLETVLKNRGMLVSDERKRRMMIKTLESIS